ncbi:hypothetical protein [Pleomorphomonas oryzae]|uniref:hypothetical protein n=1 Tax=Pleomorphomonas oryzae TaxID=261934 RepID=UPI0004036076|nr:hypothetical protein [Pleomorphomonas oryzae]
MTHLLTGKRCALLAIAALSLSACSALGTSVADDDPETEVPNVSMGRAVMEGLGAVPSRKTAINYTPRAPLVVPPNKLALVAPEDPKRLESSGTWPEDNDIKARKVLTDAAAREAGRDDKDLLPASEMTAIRVPDARTAEASDASVTTSDSDRRRLLPSQLGNIPRDKSTRLYDANGKPVRRALVEPPVSYLEPAPGVPVTTDDGAPPEQQTKKWWKFW